MSIQPNQEDSDDDERPDPTITFGEGKKNGNWYLKLSNNGIKFNREVYPEWNEDDFAKRFIDALEDCFNVKITKKKTTGWFR